MILNAVGGECVDDFQRLRDDPGLSELIGHEVPSPEAARAFLHAFHEQQKIEDAKQRREPEQIPFIPEESAPLEGLGLVKRDLVHCLGERCPEQQIATVDQDATIIESRKRGALATYEEPRGYQPMLAVWAEMDVVLADEFRDGNVPAQMAPLTVAKAAFAALPPTVKTFYYRGDSACHESNLVNWLRDDNRAEGPQGFIGFAISARMSEALHGAILRVAEKAWDPYGEPHPEEIRECADVPFVPGEKTEHKGTQPLRYVAIRIRKKQGALFDDGSSVRHFAVVTNLWDWEAARLIQWHREKAGTVEGVHDVLKNELGGRGAAFEILRCQCRLVTACGDFAQRADSPEATGAAGGVVDGAAQAVAVSDSSHAWTLGPPRAQARVASSSHAGVDRRLEKRHPIIAPARLDSPLLKMRHFYRRICRPRLSKTPLS